MAHQTLAIALAFAICALSLALPTKQTLNVTQLANELCDRAIKAGVALLIEGDECEIDGTIRPIFPNTTVCFRCNKILFLPAGHVDVSGDDGAPAQGHPSCPPVGGHGSRGARGNDGGNGTKAGTAIFISNILSGNPNITATGGAGGPAQCGAPGGDGAPGAPGQNYDGCNCGCGSVFSCDSCSVNGGNGGRGGSGGPGGDSGSGGSGGDGGTVIIAALIKPGLEHINVAGGPGGSPAEPGLGGLSGRGGKGGMGWERKQCYRCLEGYSRSCCYGSDGPDGVNGEPGLEGKPGADGLPGQIIIENNLKSMSNKFEDLSTFG